MWKLLCTVCRPAYLRDGPAIGGKPDPAVLYNQAQVTNKAVTDYFNQQVGPEDPAARTKAETELATLRDSLALAGPPSPELQTVRGIREKLTKGGKLDEGDVAAIQGVVKSLGEKGKAASEQVDGKAVAQRAAQIDKLASGFTGDSDEKQILKLLGESKNGMELRGLLNALKAKGWDYLELFKEMDSEEHRQRFLALTAPAMSTEQKAGAIKQFMEGGTPESQEKAMSYLLGSARTEADREALLKALQAKGISYERVIDELDDPRRIKSFETDYRKAIGDVSDPVLMRQIDATPNAKRARKLYFELQELQMKHGRERLSDNMVRLLTQGVANPRSSDARGQAGVMGLDAALRAAQALVSMTDGDFERTRKLLEKATSGSQQPELEQQVLLKSIGANYQPPGRFLLWLSPTDEQRNDQFFKQLGEMARGMHGMDRAGLVRNTTLIGVEEGGASLQQRYGASCVPTTIQLLKGEQDPLYAWQLQRGGPIHGRDDTGQVAADQKAWLEAGGGVPVPVKHVLSYLRLQEGIDKRIKEVIAAETPELERAKMAIDLRITGLQAALPPEPAQKIEAQKTLLLYITDPAFTPSQAQKQQIEQALAELKDHGSNLDQARVDAMRASKLDQVQALKHLRTYVEDPTYTPSKAQMKQLEQALADLAIAPGGGSYPDMAELDGVRNGVLVLFKKLQKETLAKGLPPAEARLEALKQAQVLLKGGGEGMSLKAIIHALNQRTGRNYRVERVIALLGKDELGVSPQYLDKAARVLEDGQAITLRIGNMFDGHAMLMSDVRGTPPDRQFLVSDPSSGTTQWVDEPDLKTGKFVEADAKNARGIPYGFNVFPFAHTTDMFFPEA